MKFLTRKFVTQKFVAQKFVTRKFVARKFVIHLYPFSRHCTDVFLFQMFRDDIKYLLSMEALWKKRRPPLPLDWDNLPQKGKSIIVAVKYQRFS